MIYSISSGRRRLLTLAALFSLLFSVLSPVMSAHAQEGEEQLTINQIDGRSWPEIKLNLTLTGPGGAPVPGLEAAQFEVREADQPQAIAGIALGQAQSIPLALVLAMDVSGSMSGEKLDQAKAAARTFLASLRPEDQATLVAFNQVPRVAVAATNDRGALEAGINAMQAAGNTAAFDALHRSATILAASPAGARRVVVLLTDGEDTSSRYSAGVASQLAQQSGALVYTVGLGPDANDAVLNSLAEPTGGRYYRAPGPGDLQAIYAAISLELSSQFLLVYNSATRVDRSYKLITVQVKYTSRSGQIITKSLRYRPPLAALIQSTPVPGIVTTPLPMGVGGVAAPPAGPPEPSSAGTGSVSRGGPDPWSALVAVLVALALASLAIALGLGLSPSPAAQRLARYTGQPSLRTEEEGERTPGFLSRVLGPSFQGLGGRLAKLTPKGMTDHIQKLLILKGPPYKLQLGEFLAIQFALAVLLTSLFVWLATRVAPNAPAQWLLLGLLGLVLGIYLPYSWLSKKVRARQQAILRSLPSALDFLSINVEAGMGFDAAIAEIVRRWRNALTEELALLLIDFQIGKPRKDAWRELVQRTQVPDLTAFVTAMLQNEQVGSSIGQLLRVQAEQMRIRRRQRAEEAARVAPVKMLLPLVFFVFPGILVVLLGPSIPQFLEAFTGLGQ